MGGEKLETQNVGKSQLQDEPKFCVRKITPFGFWHTDLEKTWSITSQQFGT